VSVRGSSCRTESSTAGAAARALAALALLLRRSGGVSAGVAGWERQRQAEELGQRAHVQEAHYRRLVSGLSEAVDYLVGVQLPGVLDGSAAPQSFSASAAVMQTEKLDDR
jgi:hypothetical protein